MSELARVEKEAHRPLCSKSLGTTLDLLISAKS
jgi:hypothetical protein